MIKTLSYLVVFAILMSAIPLAIASDVHYEINAIDRLRPELPEGEPHTDKLVHLIELKADDYTSALSETKILIVTSGHGPLTGILPQDEKDYWVTLLGDMGYTSVHWYDGIPTFDLLNQYDLVIYDAGGYWYPLSYEVEPLWDYHFAGKPLIIVAPDINYDWGNIEESSKPTFCEDVMHIEGVLGILPEVGFDIITNTGHEIIVSVPTNVEIPVASQSSWPDCFDPASDCDGVLTQGYIDTTEFGVGSCSDLPSYEPYDPEGNLFLVVAYSGSESEGRTVLYGFPPTAIGESDILDLLAEGTINWALAKEKPAEIDLTLYIEDATTPEDAPAIVNKAPGDVVDIVAQVVNKEDKSCSVSVTIDAQSHLIYKKCFNRTNFTDIEETPMTSDVSGNKYTVTINLGEKDTIESSKQIVWRFQIPEDEHTDFCPTVFGAVKVNDVICDESSTMYSMIDNAKAIIITNRHLLFEKYGNPAGGSSKEVRYLLNYLYKIGDYADQNCIIYYVDHYNESLKKWNASDITDADYAAGEDVVNRNATIVDDLIEENFTKKTNPPYLMIVGGDEVIPFYRHDDSNYYNTADNSPENSDDPVLHVFDENYFISDSPYADVSGNDYDEGEVELYMGRIVGYSVPEIENFIQIGLVEPDDLESGLVASRSANHDVDAIITALNKKNANIIGENNPDLTENDAWTEDDLKIAMERGFQVMAYLGHGAYDALHGTNNWPAELNADELDNVNSNGCISDNNSLFVFHSCRVGVVTDEDGTVWKPEWDDCMLYALVNQNCSGVVAAGGKAITDTSTSVGYGELLVNDYLSHLITDNQESLGFGHALQEAKKGYDERVVVEW